MHMHSTSIGTKTTQLTTQLQLELHKKENYKLQLLLNDVANMNPQSETTTYFKTNDCMTV
jgi:hypothetical protein